MQICTGTASRPWNGNKLKEAIDLGVYDQKWLSLVSQTLHYSKVSNPLNALRQQLAHLPSWPCSNSQNFPCLILQLMLSTDHQYMMKRNRMTTSTITSTTTRIAAKRELLSFLSLELEFSLFLEGRRAFHCLCRRKGHKIEEFLFLFPSRTELLNPSLRAKSASLSFPWYPFELSSAMKCRGNQGGIIPLGIPGQLSSLCARKQEILKQFSCNFI
ncbi:hypothetical protein ACJIZ3_015692 [Penstemon smallii]|uniref:Uncharacterized protein n=1 Tax=Penstemon smallii TaxID=265156 RepID=A0ABD3RP01_9LAMI